MAEIKLRIDQQKFLIAVLEGRQPSEAIQLLFRHKLDDKVARQKAGGMMKNPAMQAALAHARAQAAERADLRVDDMIVRLEEIRQMAMRTDPPQLSAGVAAVMGQAKILGLVIDRSQVDVVHHKPAPFFTKTLELTEEQWLKQFEEPEKKQHNTRNER